MYTDEYSHRDYTLIQLLMVPNIKRLNLARCYTNE